METVKIYRDGKQICAVMRDMPKEKAVVSDLLQQRRFKYFQTNYRRMETRISDLDPEASKERLN